MHALGLQPQIGCSRGAATGARRVGPARATTALQRKPKHVATQRVTVRPHAASNLTAMVAATGSPELNTALLLAGGVSILAAGAFAAFKFNPTNSNNTDNQAATPAATTAAEAAAHTPEEAVLVFGASGKTGREVVATLLRAGRDVIAACRDPDRLEMALASLQGEPLQAEDKARLFVRGGVDVTDAATLTPELFAGAVQVVTALGPVFGKLPEGGFGFFDGMTSEKVDAEGVANVAAAAKALLPRSARQQKLVVGAEEVAQWTRLDDVIMGGRSSSYWQLTNPEGKGPVAVWQGELVMTGGGFCGTRSPPGLAVDLSGFDGLSLRVKGDGQRYKVNLKTEFNERMPEYTFQAGFNTVAGEWATVDIPFSSFIAVKMGNEMRGAPPLDASTVRSLGLVLSRFEFNGLPNAAAAEGPFRLEVQQVGAYKAARPQLVHMSSGGVERNARIETVEDRKACTMPIVQLNPGGTLNHKYFGETAVRNSGLQYTVVRAAGLVTEDLDKAFTLQALQGDRTSGRLSRAEAASVLAAACASPTATGKTFEVRRADEENNELTHDMAAMFANVRLDADRTAVGLPPFPKPGPPMGMPDAERTQEILKDDRVQASLKRGDGGTVRAAADAPEDTEQVGSERAEASLAEALVEKEVVKA